MKTKFLPAFAALILISCNNNTGSTTTLPQDTQTYQEKVMSVEETEKANPTAFLKADGSYKENFWGDKFKIFGTVTNSATVAHFKDIQIEVTFYSKTDTELDRKTYTLYERVKPGKTINFEWKVDKPSGAVKQVGWKVVGAVAE